MDDIEIYESRIIKQYSLQKKKQQTPFKRNPF
jgi:hypothetical protein